MSPVLPRLERGVVHTLVRVPPGWARRLAGAPPPVDDGAALDPTIRLILAMQRWRGLHGLVRESPQQTRLRVRQQTALTVRVPTPVGAVHELEIPGPTGPIRARHYRPAAAGPAAPGRWAGPAAPGRWAGPAASGRWAGPAAPGRSAAEPAPLLVFLHGGGFVAGDLDSHDEPCRMLCRHGGLQVLSIDYRLAPEHPFPAGVEDAYAASQWAMANAAQFGVDPARVAVGGDSAGANLAAVACLLAARRRAPSPAAQLLFYPPTDYHTRWPSRTSFADGLLLTSADIDYCYGHYGAAASGPDDERHSPLRSSDLSGLPPALVVTAAFDPLRDEGEAYAEALRAAGNQVVDWRVPGMVHGFLNLTALSRTARDAVIFVAGASRALLAAVTPAPGDHVSERLDGRVVLITGAARGIGAHTARAVAAAGARVALLGLEPELLAGLAAELGPGHAWFECDVTDQAALEAAVAGTVAALGRIDVVVANAGVANLGTVAVGPADALVRTIEVNLLGVVRTVCATLPAVTAARGYYLLVSSIAAFTVLPGMAAYCAAKAGVEQFGNALRLEVAHLGVGVGTAHMSWIDTDLVRDAHDDLGDLIRGRLPGPLGRVTPVRECARAFLRGIARRRRRVYVPRSAAVVQALRTVTLSPAGDLLLRRAAASAVPELEERVRRLGRAFGRHSAG